MTYNEILSQIKIRLGDNYSSSDEEVLKEILNKIISQASYISNRDINLPTQTDSDDNLLILSPEIMEATIVTFEQRGVEYTKSQSELGTSNSFIDVNELLRNNIIKNSKRVMF